MGSASIAFRMLIVIACVHASVRESLRQNSSGQICSNSNGKKTACERCTPSLCLVGNACLFITCENGGHCMEDPTTADCFKCQCLPGFTGRICDAAVDAVCTYCHFNDCHHGSLACILFSGMQPSMSQRWCVCLQRFSPPLSLSARLDGKPLSDCQR